MNVEIKHRYTGAVLFTCDVPEGVASEMAVRHALEAAVKSGAYLSGANLRDANLSGANLSGANLKQIEADLFEILNAAPNEVAGLLVALRQGRIDGAAHEGECSCLVGTIANLCNWYYAEIWFLAIKKGDTPETSQVAKITEEWILRWQAANPLPPSTGEVVATAINSPDRSDLLAVD